MATLGATSTTTVIDTSDMAECGGGVVAVHLKCIAASAFSQYNGWSQVNGSQTDTDVDDTVIPGAGINVATPATTSTTAGITTGSRPFNIAANPSTTIPTFRARINLEDSTSVTYRIGFYDAGTFTNGDNWATFKWAGSGNWLGETGNGTTSGTTDLGIAPVVDIPAVLMLRLTGSSADFYIDGSLVGSRTSTLPLTTASLAPVVHIVTGANAAKSATIIYMSAWEYLL